MISRPTVRDRAQDWCHAHEYSFIEFRDATGEVVYVVNGEIFREYFVR